MWEARWQCFPEVMPLLEPYGKVVGTSKAKNVLESIYEIMPARNFSLQLMERLPEWVVVMELRGVHWSDWGKAEQILEALHRIGKQPEFFLGARNRRLVGSVSRS